MRNLSGTGIFLLLALSSCLDTPNFDNTPSIQFNGVRSDSYFDDFNNTNADSLTITINFEDGDGDLGLTEAQRGNATALDSLFKEWGNYELTILERQKDGTFKVRPSSEFDKLFFNDLKAGGKPGPIKGRLDLRQSLPASRFAKPTVVKFMVRIRDRAFRVSNTVETDTITVLLEQ